MALGVRSFEERPDGRSHRDTSARLALLGGFALTSAGQAIQLPAPAQRLVAYLALQEQPRSRAHVAGSLWLDSSQERALASLRSAVWRARSCDVALLDLTAGQLSLADGVRVDAREVAGAAHRLIDEPSDCDEREFLLAPMTKELLPDWFDDWAVLERERLRQLFLHGLEAMTRRMSALGRHANAIEAGTAAVQHEPLRESAHRTLIEAHLAEGNRNEALRQYRSYCRLLREELGLGPSPGVIELVDGALHGQATRPVRRSAVLPTG